MPPAVAWCLRIAGRFQYHCPWKSADTAYRYQSDWQDRQGYARARGRKLVHAIRGRDRPGFFTEPVVALLNPRAVIYPVTGVERIAWGDPKGGHRSSGCGTD